MKKNEKKNTSIKGGQSREKLVKLVNIEGGGGEEGRGEVDNESPGRRFRFLSPRSPVAH